MGKREVTKWALEFWRRLKSWLFRYLKKRSTREDPPTLAGPAGVWYRLEGENDFQRLGTIFRRIHVVGHYGWLDVDDFHFCFDPTKYLCVWWRDTNGAYHETGWFPNHKPVALAGTPDL